MAFAAQQPVDVEEKGSFPIRGDTESPQLVKGHFLVCVGFLSIV
jgi:hypothetical protein